MQRKTMKTFEIELQRTSYVTLQIEADTPEEAEALAWKAIENRFYKDDGDWTCTNIYEQVQA
jgi:hypothetical protein